MPAIQRKNSVIFFAAYADACALWRLYMPSISLAGSHFFHFNEKPDWTIIAGYDTVVVQRCFTNAQFDFLRICKALGQKIIYELDDDVWNIPPYNPAYATLNAFREGFNACIKMVDLVTVSTRDLAKVVLKYAGKSGVLLNTQTGRPIPIVVAENRIEERLFTPPADPDPLLVGWAGSSSHIGDISLIEPAIVSCAAEHPEMTFQFRGCVLAEDSPIIKLPNYRHVLWTPVPEYIARMPIWRWSIALAPVQDIAFNQSKSSIKLIEAGYCGIPCLASWVNPYYNFCSKDKELLWLLCRTPGEWERKLRTLINEPERCKELGRRMRVVVDEHYSFNKPHEGWLEALETV
jgi:glycosyltransferase involved in cell wall biosynthesis